MPRKSPAPCPARMSRLKPKFIHNTTTPASLVHRRNPVSGARARALLAGLRAVRGAARRAASPPTATRCRRPGRQSTASNSQPRSRRAPMADRTRSVAIHLAGCAAFSRGCLCRPRASGGLRSRLLVGPRHAICRRAGARTDPPVCRWRKTVRFTEDSRVLLLGEGLWKTVTRQGRFPTRLSRYGEAGRGRACRAARERCAGALSVLLHVEDRRIAGVEAWSSASRPIPFPADRALDAPIRGWTVPFRPGRRSPAHR